VNWDLLEWCSLKPHPLLHIAEGYDPPLPIGVGEVLIEARTAHHVLDLVGIPNTNGKRQPDVSDLDARVYLATRQLMDLDNRLTRLKAWHSREAGPGGTVGDFCNECGTTWPCDTYRMADGSYRDEDLVPAREVPDAPRA
jgi:hypothetical protein